MHDHLPLCVYIYLFIYLFIYYLSYLYLFTYSLICLKKVTFLGGEEGGTHKSSMIFVEHALMIQTPTPRPNSRVQRAQFFTLDSCPPEDTWYGVILWVLRVLGQSLNQSARIFCTRAFWLLRHTVEPQRGRNSCLWLQSRSVLSSFCVVLMSCRVNFHVVRSALQYSACRI